MASPLQAPTETRAPRTAFVNAMAAAVSGVTVVTTDGVAGRWGLTVSSAASVSAEPPMLLVCVNWRSPLAEAIRINNVFGVNVLGVHHTELAESFAGRLGLRPPYDFGDPNWLYGSSGVPLLADAAARFECRVSEIVDAGSHAIVIATVTDASRGAVPALAYTRRDYARAERLG